GPPPQAFMNTFLAAAMAGLTWMAVEWVRDGRPTNLGAASGIVAGLVAITPGARVVRGSAARAPRRPRPAGGAPAGRRLRAGCGADCDRADRRRGVLLRGAGEDQSRLRRCP